MSDEEYVKIESLESTFEAQVVGPILEEEQIPHFIRSFHDTAYNGIYQMQKGWGEIRAPLSQKERILEILHLVRSGNHDIQGEID